jgi:16S rRNA (guanine527-N7)-methyltransferase
MDVISKYFGDLTPEQLNQFAALDELYRSWNERINVISRKDIGELTPNTCCIRSVLQNL